jgi:hypothetical protein
MIKSRKMRLAGYVKRMEKKRNAYFLSGKAGRKEATGKTKT